MTLPTQEQFVAILKDRVVGDREAEGHKQTDLFYIIIAT